MTEATIIDVSNIEKAKGLIKLAVKKPIIVIGKDEEFNRKILEYGKFNILSSIEKLEKKDMLRHIDSNFNHVLAKIAVKNNIALGLDMFALVKKERIEKAKLIVKIKQNIRICKKIGVKIKLLNYKNKENSFSFLLSLGATTQQARESLE